MRLSTKLLLWLVLAVVLSYFIGRLNVPTLYALNDHGIPAEAVIVSITPEIHNSFQYVFSVGGKRYEGGGFIHDVPEAVIGEKVSIRYLAESPNVSSPAKVRAELENQLWGVGVAVLILPTFIMWRISTVFRKGLQLCADYQVDRKWAWVTLLLGPFVAGLVIARLPHRIGGSDDT